MSTGQKGKALFIYHANDGSDFLRARGRRRFQRDSVLEKGAMKPFLRLFRGWLYRRYPALGSGWYRKKLAGYERRWGLEDQGFTKEGFLKVFHKRFLGGNKAGRLYELVAGDGLVGSLGVWLEGLGEGWSVEAWEHRPVPLFSLKKTRLEAEIHGGRLTKWSAKERKKDLVGITTRGSREATGVCREIRTGQIRPQWVGLWNPTSRPAWFHRMSRVGYQLVLVYQRMEFYVDGERGSGVGGRETGVGGRESGGSSRESGVVGGQKREK